MRSIQSLILTTNTNAEVNAPATTNPASIVSSLPPEALYAQAFQPLYAGLNPVQDSAVPTRPLPFQLSAAQNKFFQDPSQFVSTLQSASQGLGGLLNSLDTAGTSDQINKLIQDAQTAATNGDGLTAQKDMAQAQLLFSTMSTMLNLISQLQMEAIKNSKLQ
jgi:hypothetical protein